ncbi:MAG: YceI family protein [Actinomycetota bacterium]|jgi:polyisoprenoid-binding protein YceI|nr:YceI family protein [Actinomycetota bacterium]
MAETETLTRTLEGAPAPLPGTYHLDKAHSIVGFVVRHLMVSKVRGQFNDFDGEIVVGETLADSKVSVTIQVASIDTREEQRDGHLKSGDFFELETYPTITFVSTAVRPAGGDWKVDGNLTIKGSTRPVTLDVEFLGATGDPWGGKRIGFSARTEIDRDDYGMNFNAAVEGGGLVVGKRITIELEAEAVLSA